MNIEKTRKPEQTEFLKSLLSANNIGEWEIDFIKSIVNHDRRLSYKQKQVIKKIAFQNKCYL